MTRTSSLPSDGNLFLESQLQKSDPHQFYYLFTIGQILKCYGFDVVKSITGFDLYKAQAAVIILGSTVGTIVLCKSPRGRNAVLSLTTLPLKLNQSLSNVATRLPIMKLEELPEDIRLSGKILSAVYLMASFPVISELMTTGIDQDIAPLMPATGNPLVGSTIKLILNLISIKTSAQLSTKLAPEFQRVINETSVMPLVIQTTTHTLNRIVQNPHQFTYNAYIIYIVIQQSEQFTGVSFRSFIQYAICISGLVAPQIRSITPYVPMQWIPRLKQLPISTATTIHNLYHHTPLPISEYEKLESLSITSRFLHAGTFGFMAYYSTEIMKPLVCVGAYVCLSTAFPRPELLAGPAYNFIAIAGQQALNNMGPMAGNLAQFLFMLSSVKVIDEASKVLLTVIRHTGSAVETAYDYSEAIQLRWRAYREPTYHYERAVYYEEHNNVLAAVSAYQRVPKPSSIDIKSSKPLKSARIEDIKTLESKFDALDKKQRDQLSRPIRVYVNALRGLVMVYFTHGKKLKEAGKFLEAIAAYKESCEPTSDELKLCGCDTIAELFEYYKSSSNDFNKKAPLSVKIYIVSQIHIHTCYVQLAKQLLTSPDMSARQVQQVGEWLEAASNIHTNLPIRIVEYNVTVAKMQISNRFSPELLDGITKLVELKNDYHNKLEQETKKDALKLHIDPALYKALLHLCKITQSNLQQKTMLPNDSWSELRDRAIAYKKQKNYPLAFAFYCATVMRMKISSDHSQGEHQATYYRVVFNCGCMLESTKNMMADSAMKQDLLQEAMRFYQQVTEHAGTITCTDLSTTPLKQLADQRLDRLSKIMKKTEASKTGICQGSCHIL